MKRKRRSLLLLLTFLLLLVGLLTWWVNREIQHERDNASLIAAIKANDTNSALEALKRDADANARDLGSEKPSLGQRFRQLWNNLIGRKVPDDNIHKPTAIQVIFT